MHDWHNKQEQDVCFRKLLSENSSKQIAQLFQALSTTGSSDCDGFEPSWDLLMKQ